MKTYELKCTQCGANLEISTDKDHAFCQYCGHKLVLAAENEYEVAVQVQASKDAAKVKMHEIDAATDVKKAELNSTVAIESERESTNVVSRVLLYFGGMSLLFFVLLIIAAICCL